MALDLRGFVAPERKFEGFVDYAEGLAARKSAQQKAAEKNAEDVSNTINLLADPSKSLSGSPSDPMVIKGFSDLRQKALGMAAENKNLTSQQLKTQLYPDIQKLAQYSITAKNTNQLVDDGVKQYDNKFYNTAKLKQDALKTLFFNDKGELKNLEEVQYNPDIFEQIISQRGTDIVNPAGITEALKTIPNVSEDVKTVNRDASGKLVETTFKKTWKPWEQEEVDDKNEPTGQFFPKYEIAKDGDQEILHEGQPVRVADRGVFDYFYNQSKPVRDFINSQSKLHAKDYELNGKKLDENSPQVEMVKRAILYDYLEQNRSGKTFEGSKTLAPKPKTASTRSGSGGGKKPTQGELDMAYDEGMLHSALSEQTPVDGYYDVSPYISKAYKYGAKSFGKKGIKYNPSTQKFKISLEDNDKKITEVEESFDKVFATLKGSNTDSDMKFFRNFKTFKPKGAAAPAAKPKKAASSKPKKVGALD